VTDGNWLPCSDASFLYTAITRTVKKCILYTAHPLAQKNNVMITLSGSIGAGMEVLDLINPDLNEFINTKYNKLIKTLSLGIRSLS